MGRSIAAAISDYSELELVGVWQRGQEISEIVAQSDVVIDFSSPEGSERVLEAAVGHGKGLVCGVSGLNESQIAMLDRASEEIPMVYDRNMSLGIAVLERAVREAAGSLGPEFKVRVSEVHHKGKKDAPSGTALKLGEAIASSRGDTGTGAIEFAVERRDDVPGDHEVVMASATEILSFAHSVTTRQVFVAGALAAARWVVGRPPGRYSMQEVLLGNLNS